MTIDSTVTRRALLLTGAGGAGAVVLAACSGGSTDTGTAEPATPSSAPASAPAATQSTEGNSAKNGSAPAEGKALAALDDIEVGASKSVELADGKPAIITRTGPTKVVCFSAICTHEGCTVKPAGAKLDCPCHGSQYDARSGKVLGGPAPSPLPTVAVTVVGGKVLPA